MAKSRFYEEIKNSTIERQVEDVYNKGLGIYFNNASITYPFACDGYLEYQTEDNKDLKLLIEYKFDRNFECALDRAKVILQAIFYIKQFELNGKEYPNVILIADKNECFVLHTNNVVKYLDYDLDWAIAPSNAADKYIDLCIEISKDEKVNGSYIHDVDETFSFKVVADSIKDLANNVKRYVHITEENILPIYNTFNKKVISKSNNIQPNDLVGLFIGIISDKVNFYLHPSKKTTLVTPYGNIKVKHDGYIQFMENFSRDYTPIEKRKFTEISDRLIENTNRRNKGEFYTPKLFVDYAHNMIAEQLGNDWREKYVVWDNSCGTKNLTKDYHFNELYCSTLENAELEMSAKYNQNATSFQFDFLNDSLDKLPQGLKDAFEQNKPFVFLLNPPYASNGLMGQSNDTKGKGTFNTQMKKIMSNNNIGRASSNLYGQFLYRIYLVKEQYKLTNLHIALFCPTLYLSGSGWKKFRQVWLSNFEFKNACMFQASHFADCADNWGISFSLWNNGETIDKENFKHILIDNENDTIVEKGIKDIYNTDISIACNVWCKEPIKGIKTFDAPNFTNGITIKQKQTSETNALGKIANNALGFFYNHSNNIYYNLSYCGLFTSAMSDCVGCSIMPNNFDRVVSMFSARKLYEPNWVNSKDEYLVPNTEHELWKQYVADSVVYSLFNSASNQSSLRNVEYKGKQWDIKNEFFWLSKEQMSTLANENELDEMYDDCSVSEERFVYKWIQEHYDEMSDKAKKVLEMASDLVIASMKYRDIFNDDNEQYQIMNWDCGWYQIKAMLKTYMPNDLKAFNDLYKEFAEQLRPMVYELGFLK